MINRAALLAPVALLSLALLSGCGAIFGESSPEQLADGTDGTNNWSAVSLYINRAGVGRTDYEQYRISASSLIAECGQIAQGRHLQAQQQLLTPSTETVAEVQESAATLRRLVTEKHAQFVPPGDNRGLFDSGRTEVRIEGAEQTIEIKTNFDSLISPSATREFALQRLVKTLRRAAGGAPCDKHSFYGVDNS